MVDDLDDRVNFISQYVAYIQNGIDTDAYIDLIMNKLPNIQLRNKVIMNKIRNQKEENDTINEVLSRSGIRYPILKFIH